MTGRLGRPRAQGPSTSGLSTEEDILLAAAELFCRQGYGSTSTHAIARRAGISQAGLYHYFAAKHSILLSLLLSTVQPSIAFAEMVLSQREPADASLWALCVFDVRALTSDDHNIGTLYLLPEVDDDHFADFRRLRTQLFDSYRTLVADIVGDVPPDAAQPLASLVFGTVESVILRRRTEIDLDPDLTGRLIADAALRILGIGEGRRTSAASSGGLLLDASDQ